MAKGIEVLARLAGPSTGRLLRDAAENLDNLVDSSDFVEFLTFSAYRYLD